MSENSQSFDTAVASIRTITDLEQLQNLSQIVRDRLSVLGQLSFHVGQSVKFTGKRGVDMTGKVLKVNAKSVAVFVEKGEYGIPQKWKVSPSLLRAA